MHRLRMALIAAAAAGTLVATGAVAAPLDSLVIHGAAAKKIHEKYALSIDAAKKMAAACINFANQRNVAVSVAIMDPWGEMIYFERMDGQGKLNTSTAILKAKTVLVSRAPSHAAMNQVLEGNRSDFRLGYWNGEFANKGGLPIIADDQFLGAIGVGGSNVDEECAQAALEAVVGPQPPLVQNIPARRAGAANGG
jgi:glc operon protein GlcG